MALALRGAAFRAGENKQMIRCGPGTYEVQKIISESIEKHLVGPFKDAGLEVDVFIAVGCAVKRIFMSVLWNHLD